MQHKGQYGATVVSFPGTAARFKVVAASEISTTLPSGAEQRHGDDLRRYEAQHDVPSATEAAAIEASAVEIKDGSSRPGRLLTPSFNVFLRASLLAHLRRTFR